MDRHQFNKPLTTNSKIKLALWY